MGTKRRIAQWRVRTVRRPLGWQSEIEVRLPDGSVFAIRGDKRAAREQLIDFARERGLMLRQAPTEGAEGWV